MKIKYLRHEYTWSNHCITGNVLGWGITASSTPKEGKMLKELEKIASSSEPDRTGGLPVEELVYSPVCGFVKLVAVPCDAGEDKRKNKLVQIYQPEKIGDRSPEDYLAPKEMWKDTAEKGYLPPVMLDNLSEEPEDILIKMNLYDRLPDFFRVVFLCLFDNSQGLNIVAPSWKEEDFAENSQKLMYAIHSILPEPLRKKAGYRSFTEQPLSHVSYYFSKSVCGSNYIDLNVFSKEELQRDGDELEEYFFYHLAESYVKKESSYHEFMKKASEYLEGNYGSGNVLKKLEWLFYGICQKAGKEKLERDYVVRQIPELLYWLSGEPELQGVADIVMDDLHNLEWKEADEIKYMDVLTDGMTKRAKPQICKELNRILQKNYVGDKEVFFRQLLWLKEKNISIYTQLLCDNYAKDNSYAKDIFEEKMSSFRGISEYIGDVSKERLTSDIKDQMIMAGIVLLNQDLFEKKGYQAFDRIINDLDRKSQWADILKDFVAQLEPQAERFDDAQLETACYVEQLLHKYAPRKVSGVLLKEKKRRLGENADELSEDEPVYKRRNKKNMREQEEKRERRLSETEKELDAEYAAAEDAEEKDSFVKFIMTGLPQGFLTGCIMYLSNYSIMIGHWKIAVGMAGMWILLMLNYVYTLISKKEIYALWKCIGMCLLEGYLIQAVASLFLSQKVKLYYFIVLGVLTIVVQVLNLIRQLRELDREDNDIGD